MRAMAMLNLAANNLVSKRVPVFCRAPDQRRCCRHNGRALAYVFGRSLLP